MRKASFTSTTVIPNANNEGGHQAAGKAAESHCTTVTFITEDGQSLEVDRKCAIQVGLIRNMLVMSPPEASLTFPLANVKSTIMSKVIEFMQFHQNDVSLPVRDSGLVRRQDVVVDEYDPHGGLTPNVSALRIEGNPDGVPSRSGAFDSSTSDDDDDDFGQDDDNEYFQEEYLCNVTPWDQKFMDGLDLATLLELTKAANYLNMTVLLDLCCRTIAKQMTGLKAEELRKKFNLTNDFTPEEEAKMAAEFAWIDE